MSQVDDVRIRRARGLADYGACVTLQQAVSEAGGSEDVVGMSLREAQGKDTHFQREKTT